MSLAPGPLLRVRSQAYDNNALGVRAGTVPQAVQTPRLEGWRLAVDVTVRVSFAVSMGLRLTVRQGFYHQYKHARFLLVPLRLFGVGSALAGRNQTAQTAVHIGAPSVRTHVVAFVCGDKALVGEADFRLVAVCGDSKHNFRVRPLGLVLSEIEVVVHNKPDDFLVGHHFCHSHCATVHVFVTIGPLIAEVCRAAFDVFPPPSTNIVDGGEGLFGRLVYRNGSCEIWVWVVHSCSFLCERVWLTFTCADQLAQIAVDEHAPSVGADSVAFN